jgi:surface antigen
MAPLELAAALAGAAPSGPPASAMTPPSGAALARAGQASLNAGCLSESRSWFGEAYQRAAEHGDRTAMAVAALGFSGLWVHEHRGAVGTAVLQARLREALSGVDDASTLGLRLRARLAAETDYASGGHATVLAVLDEVRRGSSPVVYAEALSVAHHCLLGPEHAAVRLKVAEELTSQSFRTGRRVDLLMGMLWQTVDVFLAGEAHAQRRLNELRQVLDVEDHCAIRYVVDAIEVMLTVRAGRLAEAEAQARACLDLGNSTGDADAMGWYGLQLVGIRWYQGRLPELLPLLDRLANSPTLSTVDRSVFAGLAVAHALAGDRQRAASALATLCGRDLGDLPRSSGWLATMHGVAEAAWLLGDAGLAGRVYELLGPYRHLLAVASLGVACFGSVQHALGLAAMTTGDLDRAVWHLAAAVDRNLAIGHWPAVVLSRLRYARALELRGDPGDESAARHQRAVAAQASAALGLDAVDPGTPASAAEPARCDRQGRRWRMALHGRAVLVEHSVGMLHLAVLLANPCREVPAVELVSGVDRVSQAAATTGGSGQPVLDRTAITQYSARLAELREAIDRLADGGDDRRAAQLHAERDWLVAELSQATGLGGRTRRFTDGAERARLAVGRAIRRAIDRVEAVDPVIGAHLRDSVHTGVRCVYRPA